MTDLKALIPHDMSDLSDGDLTLFWNGDGYEASLSFSGEGMAVYCFGNGHRETYDGPFSTLALRRLFDTLRAMEQGGKDGR